MKNLRWLVPVLFLLICVVLLLTPSCRRKEPVVAERAETAVESAVWEEFNNRVQSGRWVASVRVELQFGVNSGPVTEFRYDIYLVDGDCWYPVGSGWVNEFDPEDPLCVEYSLMPVLRDYKFSPSSKAYFVAVGPRSVKAKSWKLNYTLKGNNQ